LPVISPCCGRPGCGRRSARPAETASRQKEYLIQ
jgi:hypothetical protein